MKRGKNPEVHLSNAFPYYDCTAHFMVCLGSISVFQGFLCACFVCSLFIFVWIYRIQVEFCVWQLKVLLLVILWIMVPHCCFSPAEAER